jgi:hypothetical protein
VFSVSGRGAALRKVYAGNGYFRAAIALAAVTASGLIFVGVRLPSPKQVRLTLSQPTLFPTDDGMHPMGAYAGFMWAMRNSQQREIDHNQIVWRAAKSASYLPSGDGYVHIYCTSMYAYLELAVTLKGLKPKTEKADDGEILYADSRSLMRVGSMAVSGTAGALLMKPSAFVSPSYQGVGIVRFNADGDLAWGKKTILLHRLFAANEYREMNTADLGSSPDFDGRPFAFVSSRPFQVSSAAAVLDQSSGLYYLSGRPAEHTYPLHIGPSDRITLVVQALPSWMSISNL